MHRQAEEQALSRRTLLVGGGLCFVAGATPAVLAAPTRPKLTVYRDPNCGCCENWIKLARASGSYETLVFQVSDIASVKKRLSVPEDLWSCHTSLISGYAIEGHVPLSAVERLLRQKPVGVRGLAVPGMPAGSPGMEVPGDQDRYEVIAFGPQGRSVFERHGWRPSERRK